MTAIDLLMTKLKWLSQHETCWLLGIYGWSCHSVAVQREKGQAPYFTTPREVYADSRSGARLGIKETIRFFGGPPGWRRYYWGNWIMFVIDKILYMQVKGDVGFKWILEFNPGDPTHIRDQLHACIPKQLGATG
jgi:hypothetical protein